jgi:ribonuclease H / adenosylcobalamin/alpha-ribazole phosphatase
MPVGPEPAAATAVGENPEPPAALDGATRLLLVRHAVTPFTEAGRVDGRGGADPDLSDTGRRQAERAGHAVRDLLDGDVRLVTSSLARARQTGAAIAAALGVDAVLDDDWDEQSFGDWDGRSIEELVAGERDAMRALRDDPAYRPPAGESHADLVARVVPAWERVVSAGGTTVVVCHRKPILVVLAHLLGLPHDRAWRLAAAPGSLTAVEVWDDGEVSVAFTNRT